MKKVYQKNIMSRIVKIIFVVFIVLASTVEIMTAQSKKEKENWTPPKISIKGKIEVPKAGSVVEPVFTASGTIKGTPRHLWLIVKVGRLHWPKEPELINNQGQWTGTVNEGGTSGKKFELLLVDVSENTSQMFDKWLTKGHDAESYPGLNKEKLGDARILDRKQLQLVQ